MSSSDTDFDATLVDWLYGELDAEAVASFEAHLETHPEHKAEAHALRETRVAFRDMPEAEPSNGLTVVLMQQAAVAAQPKAGLWAAFVGFFQPVFMHPAAMAMATVVVVAGVAGTLYVRNGNMVAETTVASSEAPPMASQPAPVSSPSLGDFGESDLEESAKDELGRAEEKAPEPPMEQGYAANLATPEQEESLLAAKEQADGRRGARKSDNKNRAEKSADLPGAGSEGVFFDGDDVTSNAISGGAIGPDSVTTKSGSRGLADSTTTDSPPVRRARTTAKPNAGKKGDSTPKAPAWEDQQVANFQTAARGKRCRDAGRIANDLRDKNPLAYDRGVKGTPEESDCSYYIASESKRRKTARKKALAKSKKAKRKQGQGKSVPPKAVAAPVDEFEADMAAE